MTKVAIIFKKFLHFEKVTITTKVHFKMHMGCILKCSIDKRQLDKNQYDIRQYDKRQQQKFGNLELI